jgi:hypothetical protein
MKVNVELDCTPEEMRATLGLPDVTEINKAYVNKFQSAIDSAGNFDQLQTLMSNVAPMGEMGLKFLQSIMAAGATGFGGTASGGSKKKD